MKNSQSTVSAAHQRGATLIVVLMILLMIMIVGTAAIQQGIGNLRLATSAQVNKLLMQNSDVALAKLEQDFNTNQNVLLDATPIGKILLPGNEDAELQFCYKPSDFNAGSVLNGSFFQGSQYRIVTRKDDTATGVSAAISGDVDGGYCKIDSMFSVGRKAVITQIGLSNPNDLANTVKKYQLAPLGTNIGSDATPKVSRVLVTVTSLSPNLAFSASDSAIQDCLQNRMMDDTVINNLADGSKQKVETVAECLNALGVPTNTQVSEYIVNLTQGRDSL